MESRTVRLQTSFYTSQIIPRRQLQRRRKSLYIENDLLELLRPHRFEDPIDSGQRFDDASVMNAGEIQPRFTSKR